jgi:hypothetical protein
MYVLYDSTNNSNAKKVEYDNFQQEFSEPEEMVRPTRTSSNSNFATPAPSFDGEPVFGDPKILSNLEKLSSQAPKSKRGRPPKNK